MSQIIRLCNIGPYGQLVRRLGQGGVKVLNSGVVVQMTEKALLTSAVSKNN